MKYEDKKTFPYFNRKVYFKCREFYYSVDSLDARDESNPPASK